MAAEGVPRRAKPGVGGLWTREDSVGGGRYRYPMTSSPAPDTVESSDTDALGATDNPWHTVVWNDPVNLMSYVVYVFRTYFGFAEAKARTLMLQVHHEGRAVVSYGSREQMETDVVALQSYGLWATFERTD